jgi:hypothetical protein
MLHGGGDHTPFSGNKKDHRQGLDDGLAFTEQPMATCHVLTTVLPNIWAATPHRGIFQVYEKRDFCG